MLTHAQVEQMLDDLLSSQSELDDAECKIGTGTPLQHALCALSNRRDRNGGVVFVGVSEDFQIGGLADVEQTQQVICDWASDLFNVPLRVFPEILEREGKIILAIIVPSCPTGARPCHFKRHDLFEGAYIRVGNSTRLMTCDEVRREIAADEIARGAVLPFDRLPCLSADISQADDALIADYVRQVKAIRPGSTIDRQPREHMLRDLKAVVEHEGRLHLTHAGVLFFCAEPQDHLPQSSVEFLHLWGRDITTSGPDGSKWRTNREFTGTLPHIIDELESLLLERVDKRGFIDTFRRRDEPEYPRVALREAIINAVAHRDYTMRGSRVQVRLFSDRIEVDTPGGLPAPVTVDNIEDEKSTRNEAVVGLLENINYVERRGWGFNNMVSAMREAGLSPPLVRDNGASFGLCLKSHVLMSPEGVTWLRQFDGFDLSPQERLALAYLRVNDRLYNRDYVRLTSCTTTEATGALRQMIQKGVIEMKGTRGGAYYILPEKLPQPEPTLLDAALTDEERVLRLVAERGSIRRQDVITNIGLEPQAASNLLLRLKRRGQLEQHSTRRHARYTLPEERAEAL